MLGVLLPAEQHKELHGPTSQLHMPSSKKRSQHLAGVTDPDHQIGAELLLEWEQRKAFDTCMIHLGASWYSLSQLVDKFRNSAQTRVQWQWAQSL